MSWQPEIEELERRQALVAKMGGPDGIERQRKRGKLTVRERLDALADAGSLCEIRPLVGAGTYANVNELVEFTPKELVEGIVKIDGRKVIVSAGDFTVRGGSASSTNRGAIGQEPSAADRARRWRLPFVRLLDAAGGSVRGFEELGRTYLPDGNSWVQTEVSLLSEVPVVSAVLGSVAGLPAVDAPMSHFSVMVEGMSQIFPGGPPVVKAALGYDITKEELGGDHIHTRVSGCIDNLAESEHQAFEMIRQFLSYLPSNVHEIPPRVETEDSADRREAALLSSVPRDRRKPYNARKLLNMIVDKDSFFEIAPLYGRARIVGLARLNGYPVGIMINNPMINGGATDVAAGSKMMRLIQLCETFHLPLVSLADEPGFQVGLESEKQGIERAGARLVSTVCLSQTPWCTVVIGRLFGVAGQCHHRPTGMFERFCWPSASWGSMHIAGGASAAYRREIDDAEDPETKRAEIEARLNALASPFRTAEATGQNIIDPRDTRPLLCEFAADAQKILASQLGPARMPYLP